MSERWIPVVGYRGLYEVSDKGRVRSLHGHSRQVGHVLTPHLMGGRHGGSYPGVTLCNGNARRTRLVHLIVARAFLGPARGRQVDHKNGKKTDPRLSNLEYVTCLENLRRSKARGVKHCGVGERHGHATITEDDVRRIRHLRKLYGTERGVQTRIAREVGLTIFHVSKILRGALWAHVQ